MLELRPICEHCATDLPADATDARICSFECTFCARCVEDLLGGVCPNCGGPFAPRPIRPANDWEGDDLLARHPPTAVRHHRPVDLAAHAARVSRRRATPLAER